MRGRVIGLLVSIILIGTCLSCSHREAEEEAARCNELAFQWRYRNIDSSLTYARSALRLATQHGAEGAAARCNLAYIAYQQMAYEKSMRLLNQSYHCTNDQIVLLCADVLAMKVAQKTGDGYSFFSHRNHALRRISRIFEERDRLTPKQQKHFHYALTELHIVSSTYYYYLGQDSAARAEIHSIDTEVSLERDTTQWIYYNYMLGSGGLITGDAADVTQAEFHHLLGAYTTARSTGCIYFQANCLQSLASMLADSVQARLLRTREPESYSYLVTRFSPDGSPLPASRLSLLMAEKARTLFRDYKDLYQTACAYRTLGEIYFVQGAPQRALSHFQTALSMVEEQKLRDSTTVEPWMANIHEKLSMTYSALDDKELSDLHRNAYLDLLDQSRQNRELDSRRDILAEEVHAIHRKLLLLTLLVVLVVGMFAFYTRRLQRNTRMRFQSLNNVRNSEEYLQAVSAKDECTAKWQERLEELEQECQAAQFHTRELVQGNLERRAKVSLVYAIVPYLDRMRAEVKHMRQEGKVEPERLRYVGELAEEIMRINELLTEWIQVQRGQLSLHVSTFALADVFRIISLGSHAFSQKGITLEVQPTDVRVKADKALTMFMVNTLADNARKFTPSGGRVSLQASATDEYVEISIQDTGDGLSPDDVFTLNHSKVYDPREIGGAKEGKGFGFGIMNCRGIIEKYKKTSAFFRHCAFGVESEQGQGSRFWFRLPRVLCTMLMLGISLCISARQATPAELFDSVYAANVEGKYEKAYTLAEQAVRQMGTPADTALLVSLRNEMAISALALKRWDDYRWQNNECVRLHRLYSQDSSLSAYCRQMEKISFDTNVLYVLVSILSLLALLLFYHLFLRDRLRSRKHFEQVSQLLHTGHQSLLAYFSAFSPHQSDAPQQGQSEESSLSQMPQQELERLTSLKEEAESLLPQDSPLLPPLISLFRETSGWVKQTKQLADEDEEQEEQLERYQFEANRLYVMNQILDNSLSTIKHETMYYPARTRQMVLAMSEDTGDSQAVEELADLLESYRQIYMLLYQQASHQTKQRPPLRRPVPLQPLFQHVSQRMRRMRVSEGKPAVFIAEETHLVALGDEVLIGTLLISLATPLADTCSRVRMQATQQADRIQVTFTCTDTPPAGVSLDHLFTPASHSFPYLVARQAVREYDAAFGHPGLRLIAEPAEEGFRIICTLLGRKC